MVLTWAGWLWCPNTTQGGKSYYRLVRWLLTSNRAHLVRLSEEQVPTTATA
jgi:hypothetical protein